MTYQIFLSYSRLDNEAKGPNGKGWVDNFSDTLKQIYKELTGNELAIFIDKEAIDEHAEWKTRLSSAIRSSKIFLAFISPNYLKSSYCRWEWQEYLRCAHTVSRGHDGLFKVFFTSVPGFPNMDYDEQADPDNILSSAEVKEFLQQQQDEFNRKQITLDKNPAQPNPEAPFDLRSWAAYGIDYLLTLDLKERLARHKNNEAIDPLLLKFIGINQGITDRLNRTRLAEKTPSNIGRADQRFVGRYEDLIKLHTALAADKIGSITSISGLGGMGKTSLALQYAYAYAEHYVLGGMWKIDCEGKKSLYEVLRSFFANTPLPVTATESTKIEINPDLDDANGLSQIQAELKKYIEKREEYIKNWQKEEFPLNTPTLPTGRMLLILDNVTEEELLSYDTISKLKDKECFEIVATSRLGAVAFGYPIENPISLDYLTDEESYSLFNEFQLNKQLFNSPDYQAGIHKLIKLLGGYPLTITLAAANLGRYPTVNPAELATYIQNDINAILEIEGDKKVTEAINKQAPLKAIIQFTYAKIDEVPYAGKALKYASFMHNENISKANIEELLAAEYPDILIAAKHTKPVPIEQVWEKLKSLMVIKPATDGFYAMHAMVSDAIRELLINEDEKIELLRRMYERYVDEEGYGLLREKLTTSNDYYNIIHQGKYFIFQKLIKPKALDNWIDFSHLAWEYEYLSFDFEWVENLLQYTNYTYLLNYKLIKPIDFYELIDNEPLLWDWMYSQKSFLNIIQRFNSKVIYDIHDRMQKLQMGYSALLSQLDELGPYNEDLNNKVFEFSVELYPQYFLYIYIHAEHAKEQGDLEGSKKSLEQICAQLPNLLKISLPASTIMKLSIVLEDSKRLLLLIDSLEKNNGIENAINNIENITDDIYAGFQSRRFALEYYIIKDYESAIKLFDLSKQKYLTTDSLTWNANASESKTPVITSLLDIHILNCKLLNKNIGIGEYLQEVIANLRDLEKIDFSLFSDELIIWGRLDFIFEIILIISESTENDASISKPLLEMSETITKLIINNTEDHNLFFQYLVQYCTVIIAIISDYNFAFNNLEKLWKKYEPYKVNFIEYYRVLYCLSFWAYKSNNLNNFKKYFLELQISIETPEFKKLKKVSYQEGILSGYKQLEEFYNNLIA